MLKLHNLYHQCCQILDLKKKEENQVQLLKQKQKSDEAAKRLQDEIQSIKAQKVNYLARSHIFLVFTVYFYFTLQTFLSRIQVQLQHRIKQEAEQFRQWKASREKELLQVFPFLFCSSI